MFTPPVIDIWASFAYQIRPTFKEGKTPNVIVRGIAYSNLQWSRKWYGYGSFALEVDADALDANRSTPFLEAFINGNDSGVAYFVSMPERNETTENTHGIYGEIGFLQSVKYDETAGTYTLSGLFLESLLDFCISTERITATARTLGDALYYFLNDINLLSKKIKRPQLIYCPNQNTLSAWASTGGYGKVDGYDKQIDMDFDSVALGSKLQLYAQNRNMSVRTYFTNIYSTSSNNGFLTTAIAGIDRTMGNTKGNPYVLFGDSIGNINGATVTYDISDQADCAAVVLSQSSYVSKTRNDLTKTLGRWIVEDWQDKEDATKEAAGEECYNQLAKQIVAYDVSADTAYADGYLTKYNIGDMVTIRVRGVYFDAQIVEVNEVYKDGGGTVELVFGTKRISNIERAINRA